MTEASSHITTHFLEVLQQESARIAEQAAFAESMRQMQSQLMTAMQHGHDQTVTVFAGLMADMTTTLDESIGSILSALRQTEEQASEINDVSLLCILLRRYPLTIGRS